MYTHTNAYFTFCEFSDPPLELQVSALPANKLLKNSVDAFPN